MLAHPFKHTHKGGQSAFNLERTGEALSHFSDEKGFILYEVKSRLFVCYAPAKPVVTADQTDKYKL